MRVDLRDNLGVTLTEMLVVVLITGLIVAALALFVGRGFEIPREQAEQGAIVADAHVQLERLSDTLRNARAVSGQNWVTSASACGLTVRTNADADATSELVRYELNDATDILRRRVNSGAWATVARSVRNSCATMPIFTYYSLGGGRALKLQSAPPNLTEIDRIVIRLVIDVDTSQGPGPATVETEVTPREGEV